MKRDLINHSRQLRQKQTDAEKKLWSRLRNRQLNGIKFKRQYSTRNHIIDFYSAEYQTGIELDGGQHYEERQRERDLKRTESLNEKGISIIRFSNRDVLENLDGVCEQILKEFSPSPQSSPQGGEEEQVDSSYWKNRNVKEYETIIIGAGPAGIAAAIQLKRVGRNFLLIEKGPIGGLILNANRVENYPGIPTSPSGLELAKHFTDHLKSMDINIHTTTTQTVFHSGSVKQQPNDAFHSRSEMRFGVVVRKGEYFCRNLIIASGTKARTLDSELISSGAENRIFTEVYPIRDLTDQHVTIIGSGDAAFDYALTLAPKNNVTILYRSDEPKCHRLLLEEVSEHASIKQLSKKSPKSITKESGALKIETDQGDNLNTDYILTAIGRDPAIEFCSPEIKNHFLEKKEVPGLYWAGDVARGVHRQVAIAVGDGVRSAMGIIRT